MRVSGGLQMKACWVGAGWACYRNDKEVGVAEVE